MANKTKIFGMLLLAICATGCINSKEIHQSNDSEQGFYQQG